MNTQKTWTPREQDQYCAHCLLTYDMHIAGSNACPPVDYQIKWLEWLARSASKDAAAMLLARRADLAAEKWLEESEGMDADEHGQKAERHQQNGCNAEERIDLTQDQLARVIEQRDKALLKLEKCEAERAMYERWFYEKFGQAFEAEEDIDALLKANRDLQAKLEKAEYQRDQYAGSYAEARKELDELDRRRGTMTDDDHPELHTITMAVREADRHFERVGGSSRHWVRDCFLPMLEKHGLRIARLLDGIEEVPYRTPACDKHLSRNEDHECPWCKLETRETELADLEQEAARLRSELDRYRNGRP